jgi:hypothetical protein
MTVNTGVNFTTLSVQGQSRIVLFDAGGHRSFGALSDHTPESVRCLDTFLDKYDAANELPDGTLP